MRGEAGRASAGAPISMGGGAVFIRGPAAGWGVTPPNPNHQIIQGRGEWREGRKLKGRKGSK